jgi:hypothetical protein
MGTLAQNIAVSIIAVSGMMILASWTSTRLSASRAFNFIIAESQILAACAYFVAAALGNSPKFNGWAGGAFLLMGTLNFALLVFKKVNATASNQSRV